jgi:hypothetical protein
MMNWKGFGRKQLHPNFKILSRYLPGGSDESHEKLQTGYLVSSLTFEHGPPKYEAGVLPT